MQIFLKQTEIVVALKNYITQQGISLAGRTVEIDFTAGRKESGLTAEMTIEEVAPASNIVDTPKVVSVARLAAVATESFRDIKPELVDQDAPFDTDEVKEAGATPVPAAAPAAKTTSLFS